jgi:hypothetical protein
VQQNNKAFAKPKKYEMKLVLFYSFLFAAIAIGCDNKPNAPKEPTKNKTTAGIQFTLSKTNFIITDSLICEYLMFGETIVKEYFSLKGDSVFIANYFADTTGKPLEYETFAFNYKQIDTMETKLMPISHEGLDKKEFPAGLINITTGEEKKIKFETWNKEGGHNTDLVNETSLDFSNLQQAKKIADTLRVLSYLK